MLYLKLVLTYLPMIIKLIAAIEENFKDAAGPAKKDMILKPMLAVGNPTQEQVVMISKLVDSAVKTATTGGIFTMNQPEEIPVLSNGAMDNLSLASIAKKRMDSFPDAKPVKYKLKK